MKSSGTIENVLSTCSLAHCTSDPWCPGPTQLLPAFHPLTTVPLCSKQVMEEDWGHTSTPGGISGKTMTKAGGRHLGVNCEWLARAHLSRESVSPTQPWSRYHTPPRGEGSRCLCVLLCVTAKKWCSWLNFPRPGPQSRDSWEDWLLGGNERDCMAECGPQVPMMSNTFLSNSPVSWGESSLPPSNLPESGLHLSHLASFKSSLKELKSNCIISVILHE